MERSVSSEYAAQLLEYPPETLVDFSIYNTLRYYFV